MPRRPLSTDELVAKLQAELAAAKQRHPPAQPPPVELADLGPPPTDPLEANAYAHRVMLLTFYDACRDPEISGRERRKELRTIAAAIARLTPSVVIGDAVAFIREDRAELESKKHERGAKLEPRPKRIANDNLPVIPFVPEDVS